MLYAPDGERLELVGVSNRNDYVQILEIEKRSAEKRAARKGPPIASPRMDWSTSNEEPG